MKMLKSKHQKTLISFRKKHQLLPLHELLKGYLSEIQTATPFEFQSEEDSEGEKEEMMSESKSCAVPAVSDSRQLEHFRNKSNDDSAEASDILASEVSDARMLQSLAAGTRQKKDDFRVLVIPAKVLKEHDENVQHEPATQVKVEDAKKIVVNVKISYTSKSESNVGKLSTAIADAIANASLDTPVMLIFAEEAIKS